MNAIRHGTVRRASGLRPLRSLILLLAWLCATGTHWDLVQVAAWTSMWYRAAQTESLAVALEATFALGATCRMCVAAEEGRTAGDLAADAVLRHLGRPVLLAWAEVDIPSLIMSSETHPRVWSTRLEGLTREPPPEPPPRSRQV